ncbi:MAG: response regulator [Spirochaetota bacterium]|nr:response regulator [Spirochaetota bacterium]
MIPKVLIVEDTPINLLLFTTLLKKNGYEVHGAANGREGLKMAKVMTFDLILCDLAMSGVDGGKLISSLKSEERLKDVPIVVVSGNSLEQMRVDTKLITAYFAKPVQPGILVKKLNEIAPIDSTDNNEIKDKINEIEERESKRKSTSIQIIEGFPVESINVNDLEEGMITGDQIIDKNNLTVIPIGVALTDKFIEKLKSIGIEEILIRK